MIQADLSPKPWIPGRNSHDAPDGGERMTRRLRERHWAKQATAT